MKPAGAARNSMVIPSAKLRPFPPEWRASLPGPAVEDRDVRPQTLADAGGVDGRVASTHHDGHNVLAQVELLAVMEAAEEVHPAEDVGCVLALQAQADALLGPQGHVEGIVLRLELVQGDVLADLHPVLDLHARVQDLLDLGVQDLVGEAVAGDPPAEHSAGLVGGLEDLHAVAAAGQLVGGGQAAGAPAHHRYLLGLLLVGEHAEGQVVLDTVITDGPLDLVDAHRLVHVLPVASRLAGCGADPPADGREGAGVGVDEPGLFQSLLPGLAQLLGVRQGGDEPPDQVAAGTGVGAGGLLLHVLGPKRRLLTTTPTGE
jgi:hypothetical protein